MKCQVEKTSVSEISNLRQLFLSENNFQIRYHSCHERGWSDSYHLICEKEIVGYGSVKGMKELSDRDTIFEFYLKPDYRKYSNAFFEELIQKSGAIYTENQTNDKFLLSMVYEYCKDISSDVILFEDHFQTNFEMPDVIFRNRKKGENIVGKKISDDSDFILEKDKKVVAAGGFLLHYNFPFADLYMEVAEDYRKQGLATFILQEVKKECYKAGRVPAARCNIANMGSRKSLLKAGMQIAGYMLKGKIKKS